jgi:hypothetical protein
MIKIIKIIFSLGNRRTRIVGKYSKKVHFTLTDSNKNFEKSKIFY